MNRKVDSGVDLSHTLGEARKLKAAKRLGEAETLLTAALAERSDDPALLASFADLRLRQERFGDAQEIADRLLSSRPTDARALVVKGNVAMAESRWAEAASFFSDALRATPGPASDYTRGRLTQAHISLGQWEDARRICQEVLRRKPDDPDWCSRLALVERKTGNADAAIRLFRKVLRLRPGDPFALHELLELESHNRPPEEFDRELASILKYAKGNASELRLLRAKRLESQGKHAEAIAEFEEALRTDPEKPYVRKMAGFFFRRRGDDGKAFELLRPVFLHNPGDPYVRSAVVAILRKRGDMAALVDLLQEAQLHHPNFKPLWGMLAKARRQLESLTPPQEEEESRRNP